jgi:hypothetical protein
MAAKTHVAVGFIESDARQTFAQGVGDIGSIVAQAGCDTHAGDDNSSHALNLIAQWMLTLWHSGTVVLAEEHSAAVRNYRW